MSNIANERVLVAEAMTTELKTQLRSQTKSKLPLSAEWKQLAQLAKANASMYRVLWQALPLVTFARVIAGLTMIACPFASWWGSGVVIQGLADGRKPAELFMGLVALLTSLVLAGLLPLVMSSLDKIGENWMFRFVQSAIAAKAVALDQATFTNPDFAARFKQVKDRAVWRMMAMNRTQPLMVRSFGIVVITMILLGSYDLVLAAIVVIGFLPCMAIEARHAKRQSKVDEELAPMWGLLWGDLWSLTTSVSIAMLQVFGASNWFAARYRRRIGEAGERENHLERSAVVPRILAGLFGGAALVLVLLTVVDRVSSGELALSQMVFLLGAVSTLGLSLAELASLFGQQSNQAYYVNALNDLLQTKSSIDFPSTGAKIEPNSEEGLELIFDEVSFSYPGQGQSKPALDRVSLTVRAGSKVALVGPNGAGKSTAMSLITRQIDPGSGVIRMQGLPLQLLDEVSLRKLLIQLPQSLRHFNLPLRELMNLGRPERPASDVEIMAVAARTGADRFIAKWSAGLDTLLGNDQVNSVEPSGGQLQRLLLTAVLLASSRLIILDEPVSMVDPEAAKQFWDAVFKEMPHKTVIFSTHHLGAVRQADKILFIDDGRLIADGHHDELMKNCPRYRSLFESQANDYR